MKLCRIVKGHATWPCCESYINLPERGALVENAVFNKHISCLAQGPRLKDVFIIPIGHVVPQPVMKTQQSHHKQQNKNNKVNTTRWSTIFKKRAYQSSHELFKRSAAAEINVSVSPAPWYDILWARWKKYKVWPRVMKFCVYVHLLIPNKFPIRTYKHHPLHFLQMTLSQLSNVQGF